MAKTANQLIKQARNSQNLCHRIRAAIIKELATVLMFECSSGARRAPNAPFAEVKHGRKERDRITERYTKNRKSMFPNNARFESNLPHQLP